MIELTEPLQQALDSHSGEPLRIVDPRTQERYVLVREALYERVRELLDDRRLSADERQVILQGVWRRAQWDDPAMEDYRRLVSENPV